jgi:hypothetical protein
VALVEGCAGDRSASGAGARIARFRAVASIAITAGRTIGFGGVATYAGHTVACADLVAFIERQAGNGIGAGTRARLTGIGLRAGVVVITGESVVCMGIAALSRCRIACASDVALVERQTRNGIGARTRARLTGIGLCAGVVVIAGGAIGFWRIAAQAGSQLTNTHRMALIRSRA